MKTATKIEQRLSLHGTVCVQYQHGMVKHFSPSVRAFGIRDMKECEKLVANGKATLVKNTGYEIVIKKGN